MTLDEMAQRALALAGARGEARAILAIAGSPGSGKTTLATAIVARVNALAGQLGATGLAGVATDAGHPLAVHLPMDGFHLANSTLEALGRRERRGAIDTFDGWGYLSLVRRLVAVPVPGRVPGREPEPDHAVYAPGFDRRIDEPVAAQISVPADARLIVTEGNYLLVGEPPWSLAHALFAETWFCATPAEERMRRLVDRHTRFGRSEAEAGRWAAEVDGANAALIEPTAARANLVVGPVEGL